MRQIALAFSLLAGLANLAGAQELPKPTDYYPLALGAKWQYQVKGPDATQLHTMVVSRIDVVDRKPQARIESYVSEKRGGVDVISTTDKGIFRYGSPPHAFDPPICLLKYPVTVGESWKETVKVGKETVKTEHRVERFEEVEVPAGKCDAIKVVGTTETAAGQKVETTYWFAADIGMVKQTVTLPKATLTLELQRFEKGK